LTIHAIILQLVAISFSQTIIRNNFEKKLKQMVKLLFLLSTLSYSLFGHKVISEWETAKKTESVELQYRWVNVGDSLKTRELRALLTINASIGSIVKNLHTEKNYQQWSVGVENCKTYEKSGNGWVMYTLFDIPKPFTQQDLIARYTIEKDGNRTVIKVESIPEYLPVKNGISRMKNYLGCWVFEAVSGNCSHITFYSTSFTKPMFPRFIQDPIIQRMLVKSFESLIKMSENEYLEKNV